MMKTNDVNSGAVQPQIPERAPAIIYRSFGGPEVLELTEVPVSAPGPDEVLIRHTAISVNFSDVNARRGGFYIGQGNPEAVIPGNEAVGVVVAAGNEAGRYAVGDRVAYVGMGGAFFANSGSYATYRTVPASRLIRVPDGLADSDIAAVLMKGMTASAAINRFYKPGAGETVLIHGAAGGVGLILVQWAKHCGARVFGSVGSTAKAEVVRSYGCDEPILYREVNFIDRVRELCPQGVDVVYDGVGGETFMASLDCVRPFGKLINYGNVSGPLPSVNLMLLSAKGSLSIGRVGVTDHIKSPEDYQSVAAELFSLCLSGAIRPCVQAILPLGEAATAHQMLESHQKAGSNILVP